MPQLGKNQYLSVTQVATQLGVSASAVRNYTASGVLRAVRNPLNRYRLYRQVDVDTILQKMKLAEQGANRNE